MGRHKKKGKVKPRIQQTGNTVTGSENAEIGKNIPFYCWLGIYSEGIGTFLRVRKNHSFMQVSLY